MRTNESTTKLTPAVGEQWLLRGDSCAIITAVTARQIHGTVTTKQGGAGMVWRRNGLVSPYNHESMHDLIEKVPQQ